MSGGIGQTMLAVTVRRMGPDGLVVRTVHPAVPPPVEYRPIDLGCALGVAFCGVRGAGRG